MGKSSTERSRERRARIYSNKKLHDELKEKERARKNSANRNAAIERLDNESNRVLHRVKEMQE